MKLCNKVCEKLGAPLHNDDLGHLIIRLTIGLLMLPHGISKIGNLDGIMGMLAGAGLPGFIAYGVLIGEIVAPLMIILGFKTRLGAFILAFNMVVAILLAHASDILAMTERGAVALELQYFYLFIAIALMFLGGGKYAVSTKCALD